MLKRLALFALIALAALTYDDCHAQSIIRGPYLQKGTASSITVRWRTDSPVPTSLRWGSSPTALTQQVALQSTGTEHEVTISGLNANTLYHYSIALPSKLSDTHSFRTAPHGDADPFKVWVLGDAGVTGKMEMGEDPGQAAVRDAFLKRHPTESLRFMMLLGDNAYMTGTDQEYQRGIFEFYRKALASLVVWPSQGNHDYTNHAYYQVFSLPEQGEAGGVPSGTEAYYSFDFSSAHFVALNSENTDERFRAEMLNWLERDLTASRKQWSIVFFHHPPYSKGSHDSDNTNAEQARKMIWMRERVVPILEKHGVDLVMAGHSHNYERSPLLDGHYGFSETFSSGYIKDAKSGNPEIDGAYEKTIAGSSPHSGTVYVVAGNSGAVHGTPRRHPAMIVSHGRLGSVLLDISTTELTASLVGITSEVEDTFTIRKPRL